jgi:hypothetical protein
VKEWIMASLANFVANADISRTMWSLTLFFIGVSTSPDVACLLPFSQLRRRPGQIKELFVHSALDFYSSVSLHCVCGKVGEKLPSFKLIFFC